MDEYRSINFKWLLWDIPLRPSWETGKRAAGWCWAQGFRRSKTTPAAIDWWRLLHHAFWPLIGYDEMPWMKPLKRQIKCGYFSGPGDFNNAQNPEHISKNTHIAHHPKSKSIYPLDGLNQVNHLNTYKQRRGAWIPSTNAIMQRGMALAVAGRYEWNPQSHWYVDSLDPLYQNGSKWLVYRKKH